MQKIGGYGDLYIFAFETNVEKELFKEAIKNLPGVREIKDKEVGKILKISVFPESFAEKFFRGYQTKTAMPLNKEDIYYYTNLLLKHPILKLLVAISLLGVKAGLLTFLICSQIITPMIKKTVG